MFASGPYEAPRTFRTVTEAQLDRFLQATRPRKTANLKFVINDQSPDLHPTSLDQHLRLNRIADAAFLRMQASQPLNFKP